VVKNVEQDIVHTFHLGMVQSIDHAGKQVIVEASPCCRAKGAGLGAIASF